MDRDRETWTGRGTDRQGQEYEQGQMDRNIDREGQGQVRGAKVFCELMAFRKAS